MNETKSQLEQERLQEIVLDIDRLEPFFENYLSPNSFEDENSEFFREVAALKGQSVEETLDEMMAGRKNYLEAVKTSIEFKNGIPTDMNKYVEKLKKISEGIESCWDIFSLESRNFFINLAYDFRQASYKLRGWQSLLIRIYLLIPSLKQKENLFKKYKQSFFFIPNAVDRAIQLRKDKSTVQLQAKAQDLLKQVKEMPTEFSSLVPALKHLGQTPEEQIEKNKAAMAWAKARMEEIEKKRNQRNTST